MYTVYVLYSPRFDKVYIGYTSALEARMLSHNFLGHKGWTVRFRPWLLIYYENFDDKKKAMQRERSLKNGRNRRRIREEWIGNNRYLDWLAAQRKKINSSGSPIINKKI